MKKLFSSLAFVVSMIGAVSAQVDGKAIGLRFGGVSGLGAEISYQHPLSDVNRLELDLGLNDWGTGLSWNLSMGLGFIGSFRWF